MGAEARERKDRGRVAPIGLCSLALVAAALCFCPGVAAGETRSAEVVGIAATITGPSPVFVGRSGQLYYPDNGSWVRRHVGGIATDVIGAIISGDDIYAIPARAPMFRWVEAAWQSTPLARRGRAAFSSLGAVPLVAFHRHLYVLKGGEWTRVIDASRQVTAAYAATSRRIFVATTRGRIRRFDGTAESVIRNPLAAEDHLVELVGSSGGDEIYGRSKGGELLRIGRSSAERIELPSELAGLRIHCLGRDAGGRVVIAGELGDENERRSVLIPLTKGSAASPLWLPALAEGDHFVAVRGGFSGGPYAAVTDTGMVVEVASNGQTSQRQISPDAPEATGKPVNAPAHSL